MGAPPAAGLADLLPAALADRVTVIPGEHVGLHAVRLPVRTPRQRRAALPFALEDAVGRPLEQTHFALCGTRPDGTVLAALIDVGLLERYRDAAPDTALVPEQLLLPAPAAGADGQPVWNACRREGRVVVRVSDGTGFAARADMLGALWRAAGRPAVISLGAPLPADLPWTDRSATPPTVPDDLLAGDLRQGAFRPVRNLARPLKVLAAVLAVTAGLHLAIAALDLRAQRAIADSLRATAAEALAKHLPDATVEDPPALILRRLAARSQPLVGSSFLPTLDLVAQELAGAGTTLQFRQLDWSDDALRLTVEAANLETLQQAEATLRAAGLQVSSGSATVDDGAARADLTVRP